ncbi:MAG: hypothetical protein AAF432_12020 [Planctomycetota bacterium]
MRIVSLLVQVLIAILLSGCATTPATMDHGIVVTQLAAGQHAAIAHDGPTVYVAGATEVARLRADGALVDVRSFQPPTPSTWISDVAVANGRTMVLWAETAVQVDGPTSEIRDVEVLGGTPQAIAAIDGELYVSLDTGVYRWGDGARFLDGRNIANPVVNPGVLTACEGRRAYAVLDGAFRGSASLLQPTVDPDRWLFVRDRDGGADVGWMNASLRELDSERLSVFIDRPVVAAFVARGAIYVVGTNIIDVLGFDDGVMTSAEVLPIAGVRAVTTLNGEPVYVGDVGVVIADSSRATSWRTLRHGFGNVQASAFDGRAMSIRAGEVDRIVTLDGTVEYTEDSIAYPLPMRRASTLQGTLSIVFDGIVRWYDGHGAAQDLDLPVTSEFGVVVSAGGCFWVGHRDGVSLVTIDDGSDPVAQDVLSIGRIVALHPLLDGSGVVAISDQRGVHLVRRHETGG